MTDHERITGLAEQIELAQKYIDEWPDWPRSIAHFSGTNRSGDVAVGVMGQSADPAYFGGSPGPFRCKRDVDDDQ